MNEIRRDAAGIEWTHQEEEKSVKEGRGKQAARFLSMDDDFINTTRSFKMP